MRTLFKRMLLSAWLKLSILEARDGEHAIEVFDKKMPHLILLDWDMPCASGIDFLRRFTDQLPHVVVGMVTANYSSSQHAIARQLGAAFVVAQPFTREVLLSQLKPHLELSSDMLKQSPTLQHDTVHAPELKALVSTAMSLAVTTSIRLSDATPQNITGSFGIVANLIDDQGTQGATLSMDWSLCAYLNAVLVCEQTTQFNDSLRNKRTTPQMRENVREVMNILKGVCQIHLGQSLEFDNIACRGDRQLRTPYWKSVL